MSYSNVAYAIYEMRNVECGDGVVRPLWWVVDCFEGPQDLPDAHELAISNGYAGFYKIDQIDTTY